jgi:hypothetical protein
MARDNARPTRDLYGLKSWTAHKINGSTEKYGGIIHASTKVEAEEEAYLLFKACTPREKALIFVKQA